MTMASQRKLLLLSASRCGATGYLEHAVPIITQFLGPAHENAKSLNFVFVAYAGVSYPSFDKYVYPSSFILL